MPFQKNNKLGFTSNEPLDRKPLTILLKVGVKDKLMSIPNWRQKVRDAIDKIISEHEPIHDE
ncbi:hypothetical protein NIES4071_42250 [Calothrix sp. NIES-4071]|nr:hypothetical protein NIES4071_42250 [Calothrix sp. NIES-4071]BAZ58538.1 hypothetical protein NIES4105_42170 [Calothrix sp. NIES-4105]